MSIKLNLGCGKNPMPGYVNVDKFGTPDVRHDLETFPWPWETSSVGEVVLNHVLEHLGQSSDVFLEIMKELYRVCAPGAVVRIWVPHPRSDDFLNDPTHVRPITPEVLSLFSRKKNESWIRQGGANTPLALFLDVDFEIREAKFVLNEPWSGQLSANRISEMELDNAVARYNNVIKEIQLVLAVLK
jgi:hypothetical protein